MPIEAILATLLSALIHASWNAFLKGGADRLVSLGLMAFGGVVFGATLTLVFGAPPVAAWPYIAASCSIHVIYWTALFRGYAAGDMSHVYTIARGSAPALVTLGAMLFARESPTTGAVIGVGLISAGVFAIGFNRAAPWRATAWAALTGVSIAAYSLIDAMGTRVAGDVLSYKGWGTVGTFLPILLFVALRRGPAALTGVGAQRFAVGAFSGALSSAGFALVLWAQMRAPIGPITALRELSVVFGVVIAALVLKEAVTPRRWIGAGVVAAGALCIGFSGG